MAAQDLTTVAQVQNWAGGSFDNTADGTTLIPQLITMMSVFVAYTVLRRRFQSLNGQGSQQFTDTVDGTGGDRIVMKDWPITAVASVLVNGLAVPASPDGVSAGYIFSERSIILLPNTVIGTPLASSSYIALSKFPRIAQNVVITYTAGYTANTQPSTDANYNGAPTDLGGAVSFLVLQEYRRRLSIAQQSKTVAIGESIVFTQAEWPPYIDRILATYRRQWYT